MNRTIRVVMSAGLVGLWVAAAGADVCEKCRGVPRTEDTRQCDGCKGWTASGRYKICPKCSKKLGECECCRAKLKGAAGEDKMPNPVKRPTDANGPSTTPATSPAEEKGKVDPPGLPLEARLVMKADTYTLDPKQQGQAFRDSIKPGRPGRGGPIGRLGARPPEPPTADIEFELKNTGTKEVSVVVDGDMCSLDLKLEGPGAVTVPYQMMQTMEYRMGRKVAIEPGKTMTIPVKRLLHGFRGVSSASYWTEPGDYTLRASYKTAVEGLDLKPGQNVVITSPPVKIKVAAPGDKPAKTEPTATTTLAEK